MLAFTGLRTLTGLHTSQTLLGLVLGGIVSDFSSWVTDHHYHFQPCFRRPKINISGEIAMTLTCISLPTSLCADERLCDEMEKVCDEEKIAKDSYDCTVSCCHDDACNSADAGVNLGLYLVFLCIAVGVIEALNFTWLYNTTPCWWQNEKNFRTRFVAENSLTRTDAFWGFDDRI